MESRCDFVFDEIKFPFLGSRARMLEEEGEGARVRGKWREGREEKEEACPAQPGLSPEPDPISLCLDLCRTFKNLRQLTCPGWNSAASLRHICLPCLQTYLSQLNI